ncbi:L-fucose-proton symporter, partial [termite gut metagenome]
MKNTKQSILTKDGISFLLPFIIVTSCFALWGFANDITNPMVKAFSKIFRMSVTDGTLIQVAFYGGYFAMAFPAAIFIRRFSYKSGLLMGLGLYAVGALMFIPAKMT